MPPGKVYLPYYDKLLSWMKAEEEAKSERVTVTSHDGLTLTGTYYENFKGAPVEIMFHGYRGNAKRDMCGGINRCFSLKRNVLAVDHRGHGLSDGNIISFGIKERYDVKTWAEFAEKKFGDKIPLIITGISMGAATVLMASSLPLPKTVVGVVADCGYSSGREVIEATIKNMKLPPKLFYPFVRLGGKIFGGFDIEETSPVEEVKKAKLPIIILHGTTDETVPYYMGEKIYDACVSEKRLVSFEGAGHGVAFLHDSEKYITSLSEFEQNHLKI
jgi:fermentation-respiration switch protein FrsA (DUF1100 family)